MRSAVYSHSDLITVHLTDDTRATDGVIGLGPMLTQSDTESQNRRRRKGQSQVNQRGPTFLLNTHYFKYFSPSYSKFSDDFQPHSFPSQPLWLTCIFNPKNYKTGNLCLRSPFYSHPNPTLVPRSVLPPSQPYEPAPRTEGEILWLFKYICGRMCVPVLLIILLPLFFKENTHFSPLFFSLVNQFSFLPVFAAV